ncbi:uncharacterized protein Z519_09851 [Cladophialophora bantiana CBS 173.52]|uniref:NodB homology domain-containing protein n=1 Tax=Cladophialophora bantiana (strain ATCC 10958 / CBS 173.52 / CDC B-1940 / NIH 8579) TaxID=1442370 RepID=A0A0D2HFX5_CLAB1|nr:uncharacterized protein Z519_09851 [Cladophialophora bantiana CBS 173.52]KIW89695.1 hypothetical protein Z519_09851 [Cladophialophora bantiana CBS 173.52]
MKPRFILLAAHHALVYLASATAAPPIDSLTSSDLGSNDELSALFDAEEEQAELIACGNMTGTACPPDGDGSGYCCSSDVTGSFTAVKVVKGNTGKFAEGQHSHEVSNVATAYVMSKMPQTILLLSSTVVPTIMDNVAAAENVVLQMVYAAYPTTSVAKGAKQLLGPVFKGVAILWQTVCLADVVQGTGADFCSVPGNCQEDFGICDSDTTPAGYNMSVDPRREKGQIEYGQFISNCYIPRTIALTYDDGPSENTEELLNILDEAGAKATFFIAGNSNGKGPIDTTSKWTDVIKRMVEDGHQVASHTWSHPDMDEMGSQDRRLDMAKNERALANILGKYPTYMRPPYLHCSNQSGCLSDMRDLGYHVISYAFDSGDWMDPNNLTAMTERVDRAFQSTDVQEGRMLLIQHDTIRNSAINLTKHVLDTISQRGWKAVTVGECLADESERWYRDPAWISVASRSKRGCVVSGRDFCGEVRRFHTKVECFRSNTQCEQDALECMNSGRTDKKDCEKLETICSMQFLFCSTCGEPEPLCDIENFNVDKRA